MSPWETTPHSVAHGILDDETYDWFNIVEGMIETGGFPIVASEENLEASNGLVRETTTITPDHTGSAALAGCQTLLSTKVISPTENLAILITGRER